VNCVSCRSILSYILYSMIRGGLFPQDVCTAVLTSTACAHMSTSESQAVSHVVSEPLAACSHRMSDLTLFLELTCFGGEARLLWNRAAKWADDSPLFYASIIEIVPRLALPRTGRVMVVASSWS
jgi:hypothetical protein